MERHRVSKSILKKSDSGNNYYTNAGDSDTEKLITDSASTASVCDNETGVNANGTRAKRRPVSPLFSRQVLESIFRTNNNAEREYTSDEADGKIDVARTPKILIGDVVDQGSYLLLNEAIRNRKGAIGAITDVARHARVFLTYFELYDIKCRTRTKFRLDSIASVRPCSENANSFVIFVLNGASSYNDRSFSCRAPAEKHARDEAIAENRNKEPEEQPRKSKVRVQEEYKESQTKLILRPYKAKKSTTTEEKRKAGKSSGHGRKSPDAKGLSRSSS